jgi:glycosyltransferase involved in cell wall biosynthesis
MEQPIHYNPESPQVDLNTGVIRGMPPSIAFLIRYLAERAQLAERSLAEGLAGQLASPETQKIFNFPTLHGQVESDWRDPTLDRGLIKMRARSIEVSGLFNEAYYVSQLDDKLPKGIGAVEHYLTNGWVRARDPHPAFSVRFYLSRNPDVRASGIDPLTHYIECGSSEMRDPHPLFLNFYYASQHAAQAPSRLTWLGRFLSEPSPISPHPICDIDGYAWRAKLDKGSACQVLLHYLVTGWRSSIEISPFFKADYYRNQIGGLIGDVEPYCHYVLHGVPRKINPHPLFDVRYYRSIAKDVSDTLDPLVHYMWKGEESDVSPSAFFDVAFYKRNYSSELSRRGAFWHYVTEGARKDYRTCPNFNPREYRAAFMHSSDANVASPLEHLVQEGVFTLDDGNLTKFFPESSTAQIVNGHDKQPVLENIVSLRANEVGTPEIQEMRAFPGKLPHTDGRPNILLVAHIASEHLFGGERSLLDMLEGMAGFGANVFVALPKHVLTYTSMIRERCQRVLVFNYGWWRKNEPPSDGVRQTFSRVIKTNDIQVVHANTIMVRECLEAARECGVPGVVHVRELIAHDKDLIDIIGRPVDDIVKRVTARSDWIIGNSVATSQAYYKRDMTFVIPNTIDMDSMDISNQLFGRTVRVGLISSNIAKKGIFDFAKLAGLCATTAPNAQFYIIGPDTPAVAELKAGVTAGALPPNLHFPGYSSTPKEAVAQVNVVVNLSHFAESFGRTVLEAMAARRPVIAYRWGALAELVIDGRTGFLVPYKDIESVAQRIKELCENPGAVIELGANARHVAVESYGMARYQESFRKAYSVILPRAFFDEDTKIAEPVVRRARRADLTVKRTNRIAYFCWHFPVPSETFVLNELRVLVKRGCDVIMFCRQSPHKGFEPDFPIEFHRVDSPKMLARRLKETNRTVVHAHFTYPTVTDMVWPACEEANIPFTFIAHAQDIFVHKNDAQNRLAEIGASKWCLKLFTLSRFHQDYVVARGFPRNKVFINANAVASERFTNKKASAEKTVTKRVVAVHRFVEKKGLELLIQAAPLVERLGVCIDVYGYGPLEQDLKTLAASLGSANVKIHGRLSQEQVAEVLRSADLFASPSIRTESGDMDGIPTSVVESMVAGVPVLTTAIAGIPDLVEDGITGIICEPTPASIADAIARFFSLHPLQVRAIVDEARIRVAERHDADKLVDTLSRVWNNNTVDIVIVSWNNLRELRMAVDSILANTALPYHLIVCDNLSQKENVGQYLDVLWANNDHITVVHNCQNAMVGPGTNLAMAQGNSESIIYVCGKEGVSFANGWEQQFVRAFDAPDVGLAGSIGYSPSYLTGAQYPKGIKLFDKFRNPEFAASNPERQFGHVQGGLFAMRRKMVDEIGGFSEQVPHDYTDVEYSYYAESRGWRFAEVPHVLALFNKSRPTLSQRFRDDIKVAHPVMPEQLGKFQAVVDGRLKHCNMCDWFGADFKGESGACPSCGGEPLDRSLFRWLSDSTYLYRRLPALGLGLTGKMAAIWSEQFQGPRLTLGDIIAELRKSGRLPNSPGKLHLAALRVGELDQDRAKLISIELRRVLAAGATVLFQPELRHINEWERVREDFKSAMLKSGFADKGELRYASRAIGYSFLPLDIYGKS